MNSQFLKASVVLLLGFILAGQRVFPASAGNAPTVSYIRCNCCKASAMKCVTPICCAHPASPVPFEQGALPAPSQNEGHAFVASVSLLLPLPPFPAAEFSSPSVPTASLTAVPLFQRNCSYLV